MKNKEEEMRYTDMFFKNVQDNNRKMNNVAQNRRKMYEEHKKCLQEQIAQNRWKNTLASVERRRHVNTHFGPEESEERTKMYSDKALQEKEYLRNALMSQIEEKRENYITRAQKERAEDQRALEILSQIK